ncbi:MAG: hypothetical protein NVV73_22235 [Cellvibrionaceae bacterium]|nr:hypothetical protein [Cellvibrionaceae bacterium]
MPDEKQITQPLGFSHFCAAALEIYFSRLIYFVAGVVSQKDSGFTAWFSGINLFIALIEDKP